MKNIFKMRDSDDEFNNNGVFRRKSHGNIAYVFNPSKCLSKF